MKKLLLFVTMAASLLFTQCKKDDKNSMPSAGKTVRMTVTAGPGSKTDITPMGAITWSAGDKLYVGDGSKYIGCLTLKSGVGSATGVFTGNVTLGEDVTGKKSFGFFYLGNAKDYSEELSKGTSTSVNVAFFKQCIYAESGKLQNASAHHVGYGTAEGTVTADGIVTGINVTMLSKVAIARFSFTKAAAYTGALTLSGANIKNGMTVNFNGTFTGYDDSTIDGISLYEGHGERYVMLVPTDETTGLQTMRFASADFEGSATFGSGIEANKFYGRESAIEVKHIEFTVDGEGTKVKFAPGNLYYDGTDSKWKFEKNQWDPQPTIYGDNYEWNENHVSHPFWSMDATRTTQKSYPGYGGESDSENDIFFTNKVDFQVEGEQAGMWRTLSNSEWQYLLNTRTVNGNTGYGYTCVWATLASPAVSGLIIFPDGYTGSTSGFTTIPTGAVFLPAAGGRNEQGFVENVGYNVRYWASDCPDKWSAYRMKANDGSISFDQGGRNYAYAARLVATLICDTDF